MANPNYLIISGITGSTPPLAKMKIEYMFEGMEVNGWSELYNGNVSSANTGLKVDSHRTSPGGDRYRVTLFDSAGNQIGQGTYVFGP